MNPYELEHWAFTRRLWIERCRAFLVVADAFEESGDLLSAEVRRSWVESMTDERPKRFQYPSIASTVDPLPVSYLAQFVLDADAKASQGKVSKAKMALLWTRFAAMLEYWFGADDWRTRTAAQLVDKTLDPDLHEGLGPYQVLMVCFGPGRVGYNTEDGPVFVSGYHVVSMISYDTKVDLCPLYPQEV